VMKIDGYQPAGGGMKGGEVRFRQVDKRVYYRRMVTQEGSLLTIMR
jgi:hypothetical protein